MKRPKITPILLSSVLAMSTAHAETYIAPDGSTWSTTYNNTGPAGTATSSASSVTAGVSSSVGGVNNSVYGVMATGAGDNATAIGQEAVALQNATAIGQGANAAGLNSVAIGHGSIAASPNEVSFGSAGNERTLRNIAAGTDATDAVNKAQLDAAISSVSADTVDEVARGMATKAQETANDASKKADVATEIAHTAEKKADAARVEAMTYTDTVANTTLSNAFTYTDAVFSQTNRRLDHLESKINSVSRQANRGIAASLAMQQSPGSIKAGQYAVTTGLGGYGGEQAIAIGLHYLTKGEALFSAGIATSGGGQAAYRIGGSWIF